MSPLSRSVLLLLLLCDQRQQRQLAELSALTHAVLAEEGAGWHEKENSEQGSERLSGSQTHSKASARSDSTRMSLH